MSLKEKITAELKAAMREKDTTRLATLRLINAAVKDLEIARRADEDAAQVNSEAILAILAKMVKQRQESARAYEEGGRLELAEGERAEIAVIEGFLPRQLTESEVDQAVTAAISKLNATSLRDMGRVMADLKAGYAGRMDFGKVGPVVKARLS